LLGKKTIILYGKYDKLEQASPDTQIGIDRMYGKKDAEILLGGYHAKSRIKQVMTLIRK
jgi:hypothetical protein